MMQFRIGFVIVSMTVVAVFSSLLLAARETREELFRALGNLAEVVHLVRTEYVDELDSGVLSLALDAGIVESIDPNAAVLTAETVDGFRRLVVEPPAYGLVLGLRLGSAGVRSVLPGSPADVAGIERWEIIEKLDGVYTRGRPLWQIRMALAERERAGEGVVLTILDRSVDERREVTLRATEWTVPELAVETLEGANVLRLFTLREGSAVRIGEVLRDLRGPIILDLRELSWGREEEAISVADLFVASGELGGWRGREAGSKSFAASPEVATTTVPSVLVDGATEGVAEVLAAALQRSGATLIGRQTAGAAAHMQFVEDGELVLWLPVGRWLRPDGEAIYREGLSPQVEVEVEVDGEPEAGDDVADPILDRALELVSEDVLEAAA